MAAFIQAYATIRAGKIAVNGSPAFQLENGEAGKFLSTAFKSLELSYPKFYKMDNLTKLAFVGTEFLLKNNRANFDGEELALCFVNNHSSLDSDWNHQKLINAKKNTSPSIFVYTLPNILMGELAIKNKWHGENLFLIEPEFSLDSWLVEAARFFDLKKAKYCLGGWVNFFENKYDLKLFLASNTKTEHSFSTEEIKKELKL